MHPPQMHLILSGVNVYILHRAVKRVFLLTHGPSQWCCTFNLWQYLQLVSASSSCFADVGEIGRKRLSADMLQTSPAEHSFIDKRRRHGTASAQDLQGAMTLSSLSRDGELAR